ncbi:hypothetical protein FT643_08615 [Ketobacter sp. MCCC 1A13808]|uniref:hypothetical protein n=1 Tax=Ketobacter sp. MCCC 1A13808 TaxID=2602738 RepID=UPI0012EBE608|nr:hypothetical protein [Ketobacter sp. MCCC 1A13808]MVF12206.1 hypothetical protein [Ketobacter sp. MCCC 1A13808]
MMRSKTIAAILLPTYVLLGCGAEPFDSRRSTTNSPDLTGLWRLNLETAKSGLSANANITFTLLDSASDSVKMVACSGRETEQLGREGNKLSGMPVGVTSVVNNDKLTANSELGKSVATKMSTSALFDMGKLSINGGDLGSIASSNLCVQSDYASVLGQATQDRFSATIPLQGKPLTFDISRMGRLSKGTYEVNLRNGTLTITEDSDVWFKGNFSADMPNGQTVSGNFEFEKP